MRRIHKAKVELQRGRFPWRATCTCGWTTWGYVSKDAAELRVADHMHKVERGEIK